MANQNGEMENDRTHVYDDDDDDKNKLLGMYFDEQHDDEKKKPCQMCLRLPRLARR